MRYTPVELHLQQVFTIARGSKKAVGNVFVQLQKEGLSGYGEAAPNKRYDEDTAAVLAYLDTIENHFFDSISTKEELSQKLSSHSERHGTVKSAEVALEMAWLDWWGKKQGDPLWKLWGAPARTGPVTSYTIGLDELPVMQEKVRRASAYPILKVKLGTDQDRSIIQAIREVTNKPIRVDANEGWSTLKEARRAVDFLTDHNIEMVEQPMPADSLEEMTELKKYSEIPLCADESFEGREDLGKLHRAFDVINIKLMKTGSLVRSMELIKQAKEAGLQVMIGCMIESSLANTAGALLSLWADYADLDGHLLISNDPFAGLSLSEEKRVVLNEQPGLGITRRQELFR